MIDMSTIDRRGFLNSVVAGVVSVCASGCGRDSLIDKVVAMLSALEQESSGRLGVGVLELETGEPLGYRIHERFGMCSTFKLALAAVILKEVQDGHLDLDSPVHYTEEDMIFHAPVTSRHLERGYMSVVDLAEATQTTSDNPAANLLLNLIGGPAGFTERLRSIGDTVTRLDRYEPEMNFVPPGEVRDTTSPAAMATTVRTILTGDYLSNENKQTLQGWMETTRTGLKRLRAGFPTSWQAGDKTGTGIADGMPNKYNDVAVAWPDDTTPSFVVAAYYEADGSYDIIRDQDVEVLASVGRIVSEALSNN